MGCCQEAKRHRCLRSKDGCTSLQPPFGFGHGAASDMWGIMGVGAGGVNAAFLIWSGTDFTGLIAASSTDDPWDGFN